MVALTIGMAVYNDFDGVYFTLQALRLYHDLTDTELLVVDNFGCADTQAFVEQWAKARYIRATEITGTAAPRDLVFRAAQGEAVLCCDAHVLFAPGAIARLRAYYREHPESRDLLQGPLVYDDLESISTHFDPDWRGQMWGVWATDPRGRDPEGEPFEIPMQGLGVFSCRKAAWPGFHPGFRGFGGEEGYIHEKVRQAGGRCLSLPWLRWVHRFARPSGPPYPLTIEAKLRNYVLGHAELGLDLAPILTHFAEFLPESTVDRVARQALGEGFSPLPTRPEAAPAPAPVPPPSDHRPLVSCLCPTYGRPPEHQALLEEAIESFLQQTYPAKELIVLNDCPEQELVCNAPGVRVVNAPARFPSLGDKHNALVALARGDLVALWDDDDISLPWRLALSVARLGEADYYNPRRYWFLDRAGLHADHAMGYAHNASLFRRRAFEAVGGYPAISLGYDAAMDAALLARVRCVGGPAPGFAGIPDELPRPEWFYIYRWGVSPVHVSGRGEETFYHEIGERPVVSGRFELHPHWRQDYLAATRALLEEATGTGGCPAATPPSGSGPPARGVAGA